MRRYDRARSFLLYGFAISLLVHLVLLPFVRTFPTQAHEDPPPVLRFDPMPTPPPSPIPTPTPRPTAPPSIAPRATTAPVAPRRLRVTPPRAHSRAGGPGERGAAEQRSLLDGVPDAQHDAAAIPGLGPVDVSTPTATPTLLPTPTPLACGRPNVRAETVRAAVPETPPLAVQQGISGTVDVAVALDAQSHIVATRIVSSPSVVLNGAALAAARGSQFRTEVRNCEPVAAEYLFRVDFTTQ